VDRRGREFEDIAAVVDAVGGPVDVLGRSAAIGTPTLLLMGSESPAFLADGTAAVHATLPDSRLGVMAGQQHIAMTGAPDLFLGTLLPFLTAD